jgi:hypothetical protein
MEAEKPECRHYSIKDEEGVSYCRDCLLIHIPEKFWYGEIKIGQLSNRFEHTTVDFDFKDLIELQLGTSVELTNIIKTEKSDRYWAQSYIVWYKIGRSEMSASVDDLTRGTRYNPTNRFYEPKLEVVEETT